MSLTSGWANRCLISHEVPAHKQTPWRCKVARYVPCGDHETYRFVQFYARMRGVLVRLEYGTYNPGVGNLALGRPSVPGDCDLVSSIRNMLVPSLGVGQPSAQMFLGHDQTVGRRSLYAVTHTRLVHLGFGLDISGVHLRVLSHIEEVVETECMFAVERDVVHGADSVLGVLSSLKFHEKVAGGSEINTSLKDEG